MSGARPSASALSLLGGAYVRRILKESRLALVLPLAVLLFALVVPLVATALLSPDVVNGRAQLEAAMGRLFGLPPGRGAVELSLTLVLGPAMVGLVAAIGGALGVRGFVSEELASGGFETTLATGWRPKQMAAGLLAAAWVLVGGLWVASSALVALVAALSAWAASVPLRPTGGYVAMATVAPLLVALAGVALAVVVALLAPGLARPGFGASIAGGDVVSLVAVLPALGLVIGFLFSDGAVVPVLVGAAAGTVVLGGLAAVLGRALRAERLLSPSS